MISDNMPSCPESLGFLIHGFPRELTQTKEFKSIEEVRDTDTQTGETAIHTLGARPRERPTLPTCGFWISSLQDGDEVEFLLFESPNLRYFVVAA